MRSCSLLLRLLGVTACLLFATSLLLAQSAAPILVTQAVDNAVTTRLPGNVHPLARAEFDRGEAPPDLPMKRMLLVLKRSSQQESALRSLIDDQQDKNSANYHQWLTPEEFGRRFGPSDQDVQVVTAWLQSQGFQVAQVTKGRSVIEFSGTAAQVQQAFHTAIHKFVVNGEEHWANASDPQIPAALSPVVAGVHTLHNFLKKPMHIFSPEGVKLPPRPQITGSDGSHALVPGDYAVIYNINPVYSQGIRGDGVIIAVVARSDIDVGDFFDFRNAFGLSSGFLMINANGPDPGILSFDEQAEATLDVSWSGAIAPNAAVNLIISASTNTTDGVDLSELYIIDNNAGDVMTESFGACEAAFTSTEAIEISQLAEQAAAQGITYMVSSGDTGSAGCDNLGETRATGPFSVNMLASPPFTVAVGGTMFNEHGQPGTYWNSTNNPADLHSAKSYIPENAWNETCTSGCPPFPPPLAAGGGGASSFFPKPNWQSGVAGIPNDGARDLPDVSLTAAGHDGYLLCLQRSCASGGAFLILGTSASAPAFAGIMALVDQKMGSPDAPQRQGLANYVLYRLAAAETLSQCNASKTTGLPASTCIFNDVTVGNNAVPGEVGYGTPSAKYQTSTGYDLATGLGSVNVSNLVSKWNSITFRPTTTTLGLDPVSIVHGQSAVANIAVAPNSGTGTPTGDVSLMANLGVFGEHFDTFSLNGGSVSLPTHLLPGGNNYQVHAHYAGDGTFAPSDSAPISVTVTPEPSTTAQTVLAFDPAGNPVPLNNITYGFIVYLRADVAGQSGFGTASGTVNFSDSAGDYVSGNPYALNVQGNTATPHGLSRFSPGSHALTAAYGGDASFNPSTSASSAFTVIQAPTQSTLQVSPTSGITSTTNVTLTVTIDTSGGGNAPDGTVTFFSGGTQLGTSGLNYRLPGGYVSGGQFVFAKGGATLTTQLPVGQDSITAQYNGDSDYTTSTSAAVVVNVQADFDFSASGSSLNVTRGGTGDITFTIAGHPGYNGTVTFSGASCSGLPRESTCSFNPTSVTGSGSTTLTIRTTAPHSAKVEHFDWWRTGSSGILAGIFLLGSVSKRRLLGRLLTIMVLAAFVTLVGCGGGGGGGGGNNDPGTPLGSYTVKVTAATGALTHSINLTLNVQ
jgi:hypothetical protein